MLLKESPTPLPSLCSSLSKLSLCRVVSRIFLEYKVDEVSRSCLKPPCGSRCLRTRPPGPVLLPQLIAESIIWGVAVTVSPGLTPLHVCTRPFRTPPDSVISLAGEKGKYELGLGAANGPRRPEHAAWRAWRQSQRDTSGDIVAP